MSYAVTGQITNSLLLVVPGVATSASAGVARVAATDLLLLPLFLSFQTRECNTTCAIGNGTLPSCFFIALFGLRHANYATACNPAFGLTLVCFYFGSRPSLLEHASYQTGLSRSRRAQGQAFSVLLWRLLTSGAAAASLWKC